ncbi:MAG TPA: pitrilysin family protein, partial [Chloroflexota bacterium]
MTAAVRTTRLGNGLLAVVREVRGAPVASFWVFYRVGSRNEVPGITGVSHWVEHMLFKGTPTWPKGSIFRSISKVGGTLNAFTWLDWTAYFATVPSEHLDLPMRVEADRMVNATFDPAEVESERTVIIAEREGHENRPTYHLMEELRAAAFRAHPYGHSVIGWKTDLRSMTRDDLYGHYQRYYTPNNAIAIAVGDVDADATLRR